MQGNCFVFEGPDGTYKTSTAKAVVEHLNGPGQAMIEGCYNKAVYMSDPGTTVTALNIRKLLLESPPEDPINATMLFVTARRSLLLEALVPALQAGHLVICDRFLPSTYVYQGVGAGVPLDFISNSHKIFCNDYQPDHYLYFRADTEEIIRRIAQRPGNNHYDKANKMVHETRIEAYSRLFEQEDAAFAPTSTTVESSGTPGDMLNRTLARMVELGALRQPRRFAIN
jgi:dTMP kinase